MVHLSSEIIKYQDGDTFSEAKLLYSYFDMTYKVFVAGYKLVTLTPTMIQDMASDKYIKADIAVMVNDRLHELCKTQREEIQLLRERLGRSDEYLIFKDNPFK